MHNLFLVHFVNLYMFRAYLGPSSVGKTVCIQQMVLIIIFRLLSVVVTKYTKNKLCIKLVFLYTIIFKMHGQQNKKKKKIFQNSMAK